ncbi:DUF3572 domain-containing protein [Sagittula salina]|uniref:DUF3572 domain-containing protein n=1 Tax=Sagittula salina TaxID=2820268 RepID=A0A940MQK1_9RHOB|nr:DUF3572 domain-containing protein [Sagittula salina]MBP0484033.1 DUF3572 domain-containing protein [Sagittula salina]
MGYTREAAGMVGLQAVAWLAGNDELLPVFMGASGASETDFRQGLQDPGFQTSVLDFLMMDDAWVIAFCDSVGLDYPKLAEVRMVLAGGGEVHWT